MVISAIELRNRYNYFPLTTCYLIKKQTELFPITTCY